MIHFVLKDASKCIFAYLFKRLLLLLLQQNVPVQTNLNQTSCSVALCSAVISSIQVGAIESDRHAIPLRS